MTSPPRPSKPGAVDHVLLVLDLTGSFKAPPGVLTVLDAAGLSLFAIAGSRKALQYGLHPLLAVLMAAVTAAGGGAIRDVFLAQIPSVLRTDICATAAMGGATVMFVLRLVSVWQGWGLPVIH